MIVLKFGGTSVADAPRILAACAIVDAARARRPLVVVSALAGVTDLLVEAIRLARGGDREALEPYLADLERRHRWALASVESPRARHDLSLEVDALFEELRQLLRAVRILGEGTPRAADALLAFGENLSARILVAALCDRGVPACRIDPREVMITNARHQSAEPDLLAVGARCRDTIVPLIESGKVPVVGGFVGATPQGVTTTLGRGGSDTSAAVLGAALGAEEIQIWTDVDGIMSADPRLVPSARTLPEVSFGEAAELAYYGARVLHPASIAPAVARAIPVRVLNSMRPAGAGTTIVGTTGARGVVASVASRAGVEAVRVTGRNLRMDPAFLPRVLAAFDREGLLPDLVVAGEVAVTLAVQGAVDARSLERALGAEATVEVFPSRAIVCVVGSEIARDGALRARVLSCLAVQQPETVALGGSGTSATAIVPQDRLAACVLDLHRRFFEEGAPS